jgi:hypothetical protein
MLKKSIFNNFVFKFVIPDPPTNPVSNAIPLGIVIALTAVKQVNIFRLSFVNFYGLKLKFYLK